MSGVGREMAHEPEVQILEDVGEGHVHFGCRAPDPGFAVDRERPKVGCEGEFPALVDILG